LKSSSQLFPVEIVSAEIRDHYYQDVYSLKPNKSHDKSVEVALLHLHAKKDASAQKQLLFVHDAFQSHWQWMDDGRTQDVIQKLLQSGYSIWLMDWRSHGSSKKNKRPWLNTLHDMALCDLTSVLEFISEKSQQGIDVIAQGYGAQMALVAMPRLVQVRQYYFIDAQSPLPSRLFWIPGVRFWRWLKLMRKNWVIGKGDEPEPATLFRSMLRGGGWLWLFTRRELSADKAYFQSVAANIVWLCTAGRFESKARRLTRKQSRINRVATEQLLDELYGLITSESI